MRRPAMGSRPRRPRASARRLRCRRDRRCGPSAWNRRRAAATSVKSPLWLNAYRPRGSTNGCASASWRVDSFDGRRTWTSRLVVSRAPRASRSGSSRKAATLRYASTVPSAVTHAAPQPKPAIPKRSSRSVNGHSSSSRNGSADRAMKCSHTAAMIRVDDRDSDAADRRRRAQGRVNTTGATSLD